MKKVFYVLLLLFVTAHLFGQSDNRINEIREMYQKIIEDKQNFDTAQIDITWKVFEYNEEDDRYVQAMLTTYFENEQKKIVEIKIGESQQWFQKDNVIECYFNKDSLFFAYVIKTTSNYEYGEKGITIYQQEISEHRLYFNEKGECIRYLIKEVVGKPEETEKLLKTATNIEDECINAVDLIENIRKYLR